MQNLRLMCANKLLLGLGLETDTDTHSWFFFLKKGMFNIHRAFIRRIILYIDQYNAIQAVQLSLGYSRRN